MLSVNYYYDPSILLGPEELLVIGADEETDFTDELEQPDESIQSDVELISGTGWFSFLELKFISLKLKTGNTNAISHQHDQLAKCADHQKKVIWSDRDLPVTTSNNAVLEKEALKPAIATTSPVHESIYCSHTVSKWLKHFTSFHSEIQKEINAFESEQKNVSSGRHMIWFQFIQLHSI